MKHGLLTEQAKEYACESGLILAGFTVADDHSIVLCERGYEHYHTKKKPDEKQQAESEKRA